MFDHVSIGVRDLGRAQRFYAAALRPLGIRCLSESNDSAGYGRHWASLWLSPTSLCLSTPVQAYTCALRPPDRPCVDAFHAAALAAGGSDNGSPGLRADNGANYYAGFVIDPDGYCDR